MAAYDAATGELQWESTVDGQARTMCLAPTHLVVSTTTGKVYCYCTADAPTKETAPFVRREQAPIAVPEDLTQQLRYSLALVKETDRLRPGYWAMSMPPGWPA